MAGKNSAIIVTTIHPPSRAIKLFSKLKNWYLISVGDLKTPTDWKVPQIQYLNPTDQTKLFPQLSKIIGWNKYARKNLGFLYAIKMGSQVIAEVDDDIAPYKNYPPEISKDKKVTMISGSKFINIYSLFGSKTSWPRGFPINNLFKKQDFRKEEKEVFSPIQNSLLDQNGDFDAVYRLTSNRNVNFKKSGEYALEKGTYCPFHSGNTFWHKEAMMLLYIPAFTNPRVEDIWRSYIAQRIIWEINGRLIFIYPTVYTNQRNKHDYLKDFENELPLYLQTEQLVSILDNISLSKDFGKSLRKVYKALIKRNIMQEEEMKAVEAWIKEVERLL